MIVHGCEKLWFLALRIFFYAKQFPRTFSGLTSEADLRQWNDVGDAQP